MAPRHVRILSALFLVAAIGVFSDRAPLPAATPREIDAAIQKGIAWVKQHLQQGGPHRHGGHDNRATAESALAGLALLECGVAPNNPVLTNVTAEVREASFAETQTYHLALYILYLDRLGDPADVPLIQMLAVRLLAGQNAQGGWTYTAGSVSEQQATELRTALLTAELRSGAVHPSPADDRPRLTTPARDYSRLHPAVARYAGRLETERRQQRAAVGFIDDNSNTQFAILGLWAARKHNVPVEAAFDLIQKRFLSTQSPNGGWPYSGTGVPGSPSMTCVGLIGLATAVGRRQERQLRNDPEPLPGTRRPEPATAPSQKPVEPQNDDPFFQPPKKKPPDTPDDPFFQPPPGGVQPKEQLPDKPNQPARPPAKRKKQPFEDDPCAPAIQKGFANLAAVLQGDLPPGGKGKRIRNIALGRDYYFLWSLERVGVIYGLEKIGPVDWYDYGADILIQSQHPNGSWGGLVDTSFALLFLSRSNVVRDLSRVVQGRTKDAELRTAGVPSPWDRISAAPKGPNDGVGATPRVDDLGNDAIGGSTSPKPVSPASPKPEHGSSPNSPPPSKLPDDLSHAPLDATTLAKGLLQAGEAEWPQRLAALKEGKGSAYTQALLLAIHQGDDSKKGMVRQALAERLTRLSAETLRQYLQANDPELRRAAALAIAMKDDRLLIPDLITALLDEEELVVRAARAGLKSLSGQDFGPQPGADALTKAAAANAWLEWFRKQQR